MRDFQQIADLTDLPLDEVKKLFDKDDKIVLMCHSGKRTKLAMDLLKNAGFSDVSDIEGGIYNYSRLGAKLVEYKG